MINWLLLVMKEVFDLWRIGSRLSSLTN